MTLNVYVDAFNLYYGCLMDTPYKWLNLRTLCELSFPADRIKDIHIHGNSCPSRYSDARINSATSACMTKSILDRSTTDSNR